MPAINEQETQTGRRWPGGRAASNGAHAVRAGRFRVVSVDAAAGPFRSERSLRLLNMAVAAAALVVAAPVMLLVAALIKLTSRGPVMYTQTRVGIDRRTGSRARENWRRQVDYGGKLFRIYKFRTMVVGADRTGETWAAPDDPRVTRLGRFLRTYRLDELPQLFNVLRGEMSMVGPRPEQPRIFLELREKIDGYPRRQQVLPGITGWAQVNQHYDRCLEDVRNKLAYDLEYIERRSVVEDFRIMLRTVPVVIFKQGAW